MAPSPALAERQVRMELGLDEPSAPEEPEEPPAWATIVDSGVAT